MAHFQIFDFEQDLTPIIDRLSILHENSRNTVYADRDLKRVLKIFKQPLPTDRNDFLIELLSHAGFRAAFCPHLVGLITEDRQSQLKGYLMIFGQTLTKQQLIKHMRSKQIRSKWRSGMQKYGFYYNDFKTGNLIQAQDLKHSKTRVGLIDLEAISPINSFKPISTQHTRHQANIKRKIQLFDLGWYYDLVAELSAAQCAPKNVCSE